MGISKIVIAPDSFKGTLSSIEACGIIESGIIKANPKIKTVKMPISDGGEGTVDVFLNALGGKRIRISVLGPEFESVEACYAILSDGNTAVIEMAEASGLGLMRGKKDPSKTTTFGTGQLIVDALDRGCREFIIGIGGSATNDGGVGMAAALGIKFLDEHDKEIPHTGAGLALLNHIDLSDMDSRINDSNIIVACDVDNPLYGPNGASRIFGPQKGADKKMVKYLDSNLKRYASLIRDGLNIDVQMIPGSGAAGGLGAALIAFTGAKLKSGIDIILDMTGFDEIIEEADLIITGEGRIDGQSLRGKAPIGILKRAQKVNVPVIAVVGSIGDSIDKIYDAGIRAVFSINKEAVEFKIAKKQTKENLFRTIESIIRFSEIMEN